MRKTGKDKTMLIKMKESKGFTLVELMIVVAIIGILAAVAVPYYQRYVAKSRLTSLVMPAIHSIETNISTYYAVQSALPAISASDDTELKAYTGDADTHYITVTGWGGSPGATARLKVAVNTDAQDPLSLKKPFSAIGAADGRNVFYMVANQSGVGQKLYWSFAGTLATELGL
jgi:type IV pilus assembly protein PilA